MFDYQLLVFNNSIANELLFLDNCFILYNKMIILWYYFKK
ncbi:hypothetical protein CHRYSEOSP005_11950 [Chryseobacterium sp. Alg-005]